MEGEGSVRRRPTLTDVARRAGVDVSLVSRVLRNDPKGFASQATRARILEAADELGYHPHATARGLRPARTMTLGLLLPSFSNPVYSSIAHGVEQRARQHGYGLVIGTHAAGDPHETITSMLVHGRADALLVASGRVRDEALRQLVEDGPGAVVLVNRQVRGIAASVVLRDAEAAALAVGHLAALGHRSICGVFGPRTLDTMVRRSRGFVRACAVHGVQPQVIEMPGRDAPAGHAGALRALAGRVQPTALLAGTFPMGVGMLAAVQEVGVAVPDEVSVLALHDNQLADFLTPRLTTVALPTERLGEEAVELALMLIAGEASRRVVVSGPPELVLRYSTAPVSPL